VNASTAPSAPRTSAGARTAADAPFDLLPMPAPAAPTGDTETVEDGAGGPTALTGPDGDAVGVEPEAEPDPEGVAETEPEDALSHELPMVTAVDQASLPSLSASENRTVWPASSSGGVQSVCHC